MRMLAGEFDHTVCTTCIVAGRGSLSFDAAFVAAAALMHGAVRGMAPGQAERAELCAREQHKECAEDRPDERTVGHRGNGNTTGELPVIRIPAAAAAKMGHRAAHV